MDKVAPKMAFVSECGCKECLKMRIEVLKMEERHNSGLKKDLGGALKTGLPPKAAGRALIIV